MQQDSMPVKFLENANQSTVTEQISGYVGMGEKNDKGAGGKFGGLWLMSLP